MLIFTVWVPEIRSIYHMQGPLTTGTDRTPLFSQLYFLDPQRALDSRVENMTRGHGPQLRDLLGKLDDLLRTHNPYRHLFLRAKDVLERHTDPTAPLSSEPPGRPSV